MRRLAGLALALLLPVLVYWLWFSGPSDPPNAVMAYTDHSYRPIADLLACLDQAEAAGGLGLTSQHGEHRNAATGLTVRIEDRHDFRKIWVWLDRDKSFMPAQRSAVKACTGRPDNR